MKKKEEKKAIQISANEEKKKKEEVIRTQIINECRTQNITLADGYVVGNSKNYRVDDESELCGTDDNKH